MNINEMNYINIQDQKASKELDQNDFTKLNDGSSDKNQQLKKQAEKFEAVFLTRLVKAMRKTVPNSEKSGKMDLSSMMYGRVMGKAMAKGDDIGLSKMIYNSLQGEKIGQEKLETIENNSMLNTTDVLKNFNQVE